MLRTLNGLHGFTPPFFLAVPLARCPSAKVRQLHHGTMLHEARAANTLVRSSEAATSRCQCIEDVKSYLRPSC